MDARTAAARSIGRLLSHGDSLAALIPATLAKVDEADRSLYQQLCYGTLRYFHRLNPLLNALLQKPLKTKDSDIQAALLLGLYQLEYTRIPDHAAVGATVDVAKSLRKFWAGKLINGVLRRFQRERSELFERCANGASFTSAHPNWLVKIIEQSWGDQAQAVLDANNQQPPFSLRINNHWRSPAEYCELLNAPATPTLYSDCGVTLEQASAVESLPGFAEGKVSVQDEAAQLAAQLLELKPNLRVLDACCAPGGKTGHLLEREPQLAQVVAVDLEAKRLTRVHENLQRLGQSERVEVICADVADTANWWDGQPFERILLDAPCSATGVIRRHPDIKLLRKPDDIAKLAALQQSLLSALWPLLAPSGILLYATCSICPQENSDNIAAFVAEHSDCEHQPLNVSWGVTTEFGRQLLPQNGGHDGFYYAVLKKKET